MAGKKKELSHEEIWDDSELVESWNAALREYKKYHSIHAKGASKKDIEALQAEREETKQEPMDLGSNDESEAMEEEGPSETQAEQPTEPVVPPSLNPSVVLGSVKDENLKKLLMSWYYAGYYTGLYEGQQQASKT